MVFGWKHYIESLATVTGVLNGQKQTFRVLVNRRPSGRHVWRVVFTNVCRVWQTDKERVRRRPARTVFRRVITVRPWSTSVFSRSKPVLYFHRLSDSWSRSHRVCCDRKNRIFVRLSSNTCHVRLPSGGPRSYYHWIKQW